MAYRLLVVDDSETIRKVLGKSLSLSGLNLESVLFASDGREALGVLEREWVDLVLTDLNMPVLTGKQMIEAMAEHPIWRSIPVIVVSSNPPKTFNNKRVMGCLTKPFFPEKINAAVLQALGAQT